MRKWFAGFGFILLVSICGMGVMSDTAKADKEFELLRLERDGEASVYGRQRLKWVDEEGETVQGPDGTEVPNAKFSKRAAVLPESYDLREEGLVTEAKSQANSGTCWAFGGIGAMESNLLRQGLADVSELDLSELHTVWFSYCATENKNDPLYGDGETLPVKDSDYTMFNTGGTYRLFTSTLARRSGAIEEEMAPFAYTQSGRVDVDTMASDMENKEEQRYDSQWHLRETEVLDDAGIDAIKQALMEHGAMEVSYYTSETLSQSKNPNYHNYGEGVAYYQSKVSNWVEDAWGNLVYDDNSNHTVLLAGWDDTFPKENFYSGEQPEEDGAWLIRNSWGDNWGDEGYFWVSYEEPTLTEFVSVQAGSSEDYQNVYQYDGYDIWGCLKFRKDISAANVFTAAEDENLDAVALYTMADNAAYTVSIYRNLKGASPDTGEKITSFSGTLPHEGYHTVSLPERLYLDAGEKFAVEVTYRCQVGEMAYLPMEGDYGKYLEPNESAYHCNPGQSFIYSAGSWKDVSAGYQGYQTNNIPIKAFTNPAATREELQQLVQEISAKDLSEYSQESVEKLKGVLQSVSALLESGSVSRVALEQAKDTVNDAYKDLKYAQSLQMEKTEDGLTWTFQAGGNFDHVGTLSMYLQDMKTGKIYKESAELGSSAGEIVAEMPFAEQEFTGTAMVYAVFETSLAGFDSQISEIYLYTRLAANGQQEVPMDTISESVLPVKGQIQGKDYQVSWEDGQTLSRLEEEIGKRQGISGKLTFADTDGWIFPSHLYVDVEVVKGEQVDIVYLPAENTYGDAFNPGKVTLDGKDVPAEKYVCLYTGVSTDGKEKLEHSSTAPIRAGTYQVECLYDDAGYTGYAELEITVLPRPVAVVANAVTIKAGNTISSLSYQCPAGALVYGDVLADLQLTLGTDVTAQTKPGVYDVYLVSCENPNYTVTVNGKAKVTVQDKSAPGTGNTGDASVRRITLMKKAIAVGRGEKVKLTYTLSPANARNRVSFRSSKPSVVSVSANGTVTGKARGSAKITAKTANGVQASITVNVKKAPKKVVAKLTKKRIKKGKTAKIKIKKLKPAGSASYTVKYKSSKKRVAKVNAAGKITAKKKGTAVITVVTYNKKKAKCKLTVY